MQLQVAWKTHFAVAAYADALVDGSGEEKRVWPAVVDALRKPLCAPAGPARQAHLAKAAEAIAGPLGELAAGRVRLLPSAEEEEHMAASFKEEDAWRKRRVLAGIKGASRAVTTGPKP